MQDIESIRSLTESSPKRLASCSTERARAAIPLELARSLGLLPLALVEYNGSSVLAGAVRTGDVFSVAQAIAFRCGFKARLVEVEPRALDEAITIAYKSDGNALQLAVARAPKVSDLDKSEAVGKVLWLPSHAGAAQVFAELVEHGVARGASDITLLPHADDCEVRLKINGEIHRWDGKRISKSFFTQIVRRVKVLARIDPTITTIPQDGSFVGAAGMRARVSTLPTIHGENVVIRLVSTGIRKIDDIGLSIEVRERLERWLMSGSGLIVFGGPTGAGKSASLYACMRELVKRGLGVASIEDPVEQEVRGAIQSEVAVGGSFSKLVRAVVRQAPDVLAIGEVRDTDTALALFEAATTGHLVICSVHGSSVMQVLERFEHFGVTSSKLATVLRGVIVQRLFPRLCGACRVIDLAAGGYREVGCPVCHHTGYDGRILVTESLEHRSRFNQTLNLLAPNLISLSESIGPLVHEGLISNKTAALVNW